MIKGLISKKTTGFLLTGGLLIALIIGVVFSQSFSLGIALVVILFLSVLFLYNPYIGLFLLLFVRTATDRIGNNYSIDIGRNFSLNVNALLGILLIGLTVIYLIFKKNRKVLSWVTKAWLLYLLIASVSIFFSIEKVASIYELFRLLSIFAIFLLGYLIASPKKPSLIFKMILWSSVIPLCLASYQALTETGMGRIAGLKNRLYGTFSDPNSFAAFVLIIIAIIVYFIIQKKNKLNFNQNWKAYSLLIFLVFILTATFSRGGWLALIIFGALLSIFKNPKILLVLAGSLILITLMVTPVRNRVEDVYNPPITSSVYWRFQQWDKMYRLFLKQPFTGYGLGTEINIHEKEFGFYAGNPYTHNDILKNALETGVFGALAYILLLVTTSTTLLISYFKTKNLNYKNIFLII
ncbi:MAG: O-antigen ligase family protein, partial [Candidatus Moranbacteria bacterium]|nr:O-antigen ligase family protein [Candidatus Moranbacteria bacterium]